MAPDLPIEDDDASLLDNAQVVLDAINAIHDGGELIVVGQSWGGYIAPIVADRAEGRSPGARGTDDPATRRDRRPRCGRRPAGSSRKGAGDAFYHDVDPALAAEAKSRERGQSETTGREPWPLDAWPDVPTHVIIGRVDRFFPPTGFEGSSAIGSGSSPMNWRAATPLR